MRSASLQHKAHNNACPYLYSTTIVLPLPSVELPHWSFDPYTIFKTSSASGILSTT